MGEPAYIALDADGYVTLFWGDGTEDVREVIIQGPRPRDTRDMVAIIEDIQAWAEDHGYTVVVPERDLTYTDIELTLTEDDELNLDLNDVDDLLDDLYWADNSNE